VGSFFCTDTIISLNWVLTAAHCLIDVKDVKNVVAYAGAHSGPVKNGETYPAVAYFKHPKFNRGVLLNDIALIHMKPPFAYKSYVIKWKLSLFAFLRIFQKGYLVCTYRLVQCARRGIIFNPTLVGQRCWLLTGERQNQYLRRDDTITWRQKIFWKCNCLYSPIRNAWSGSEAAVSIHKTFALTKTGTILAR